MDARMRKYFTFIYYVSFFIGFMILLIGSADKPVTLWIYIGFAASMILDFRIYRTKPGQGRNLLWLFLVPALCIQYLDSSRFIGFYVWILIFYAMLFYKLSPGSPFVIVSFFSHIALLAVHLYRAPASEFLSDFSGVVIPRIVMFSMVIVMQRAILVSN
jgi:hypothetical protein